MNFPHSGVILVSMVIMLGFLSKSSSIQDDAKGKRAATQPLYAMHVVSIVDKLSAPSVFIKITSVVHSTSYPHLLRLYFLLLSDVDSAASFEKDFESNIRGCFPKLRMVVKTWHPSQSLLSSLRNDTFEQPHIFARFYLAKEFPNIDRFLYLDNDIVVTVDVQEVFQVSAQSPDSLVSMVLESHHFYRSYLHGHFNISDKRFQQAIAHLGEDVFLNAGVFVLNAERWRREHWTDRVEALLQETPRVFDTSVGDQGVFYLLCHSLMANLPMIYNLRRSPKKTIQMLDQIPSKDHDNNQPHSHGLPVAIVHFAGITGGDLIHLCDYPLMYEMLHRAALPLLFSVVHRTVHQQCPAATTTLLSAANVSQRCLQHAVPLLLQAVKEQKVRVQFNEGKAQFRWPVG